MVLRYLALVLVTLLALRAGAIAAESKPGAVVRFGTMEIEPYGCRYQNSEPSRYLIDEPLILRSLPMGLFCRNSGLAENVISRLRDAVRRLREAGEIERIIGTYMGMS